MNQLTRGVLRDVYAGAGEKCPFVVQVMDIRKLASQGAPGSAQERYRMAISDGQTHCQLQKFCFIQVKECICNNMAGKKVIIILSLDIIGEYHELIGNPVNVENPLPAHSAAAAPQPAPRNMGAGTNNFAPPQNGYQQQQQQQQGYNNAPQSYNPQQNIGSIVKSEPNVSRPQQHGQQQQQQFSGGGVQQQNNNSFDGQQQGGYASNQGGGGYGQQQNGGSGGFGQPQQNGGGGYGQHNNGGGYGQQNGNGNVHAQQQSGPGAFAQQKNAPGGYGQQNNFGGSGGGGLGGGGAGRGQGAGGYGGGGGGGMSRGILQANEAQTGNITPIEALTPYCGKWTIQARLTVKSPMKHYKNAKGEGRLFSIDLMDNTSDIKGTFFNDEADRWMEALEANRVYIIQGGTLKPANKQYSQAKSDYEITFGRETTFTPCSEDMAPKITYNFKSINDIETIEPNCVIDIIGIVQEVNPVGEIIVKSGANAGNKVPKRELVIVDTSSKTIRLTLWDQHKDLVTEHDNSHPVICVKNARVADFQGRSLSTTRSSMVELNPDMSQAHSLRGWYDIQGSHSTFAAVSGASSGMKDPRKTAASVKEEKLGHKEKPDYFTMRGWVTFIKKDGTWFYTANPENKKKVQENGDQWYDESLQKVVDKVERRYIMSLISSDHTGCLWLQCFNDQAVVIMGGKTADELYEMQQLEASAFDGMFQANHFKPFIFKVRAKTETWQDESRVKYVMQDVTPMDFKEGSKELLGLIRAYGV